jgi:hypothetical protein
VTDEGAGMDDKINAFISNDAKRDDNGIPGHEKLLPKTLINPEKS